jgi:hypothetical protein
MGNDFANHQFGASKNKKRPSLSRFFASVSLKLLDTKI